MSWNDDDLFVVDDTAQKRRKKRRRAKKKIKILRELMIKHALAPTLPLYQDNPAWTKLKKNKRSTSAHGPSHFYLISPPEAGTGGHSNEKILVMPNDL